MIHINNSEIDDVRQQNDFKGVSFSGFKKTDVKKELLNNLYNAKLEPACYWAVELVCSGHYIDLWNIIIEFYTKHIHIGNPKLIVYLRYRIDNFKEIVHEGYAGQELRMRNSSKIRRLFCEIIFALCESTRKHCFSVVKVDKDSFNISNLREQFRAPNTSFSEDVIQPEDPAEIGVAINEMVFNLSTNPPNPVAVCYWIEWILELSTLNKAKKQSFDCERRIFAPVDTKFQCDIVWIIWDTLITEALQRHGQLVQTIVDSALHIFCLRYTKGCYKKRRLLIYFAVAVLTEPAMLSNIEIIKNKHMLEHITNNIDKIYVQIKINEHSPGTNYLFSGLQSTNLEKTINQLERLRVLDDEFLAK